MDNKIKAQILANYLEQIQWALRPVIVIPERPPIGPKLFVYLGSITLYELKEAAKSLRGKRACVPDKIPTDFWKSAILNNDAVASWILFVFSFVGHPKMY